MPTFTSYDGATLAYREQGSGEPVLVIPGGPAQDVDYLGDLGGLAAGSGRRLVMLELRGTGASPAPDDTEAYWCGRIVGDVEALRRHLGVNEIVVLAHSAGASVALQHLAQHPERVARLVLVTPSTRALDLVPDEREIAAAVRRRSAEPWFEDAAAALEVDPATPESSRAVAPFSYGRWDDACRAHAAAEEEQRNPVAAAAFYAPGSCTPEATCAALRTVQAPVHVIIGGLDLVPGVAHGRRLAELIPTGDVRVVEGAGHLPWVDEPERFVACVVDALGPPS